MNYIVIILTAIVFYCIGSYTDEIKKELAQVKHTLDIREGMDTSIQVEVYENGLGRTMLSVYPLIASGQLFVYCGADGKSYSVNNKAGDYYINLECNRSKGIKIKKFK